MFEWHSLCPYKRFKHLVLNICKSIMCVWTLCWQINSCLSNLHGLVWPSSQSSGQPNTISLILLPVLPDILFFSLPCWRGSWVICPSVFLSSLTSIALEGKKLLTARANRLTGRLQGGKVTACGLTFWHVFRRNHFVREKSTITASCFGWPEICG